jgi:hypothetical protein
MRNEELLLLIGKLNYAWTNTESLLIYLMAFLMRSAKDVAIVTFLTLNTSRARLEFIERLLRLDSTDPAIRARLTPLVARMKAGAKVRNKYNHCIYSFDEHGEIEATQLMRIADYGDTLRYGKIEMLDDAEIGRIDDVISEIVSINRSIFDFIREKNIRY